MPLPPQKFIEVVFQMLYGFDFLKGEEEEIISMMMDQLKITKSKAREAYNYVKKIVKHIDAIDEKISKASKNYKLNRIAKVELNILRVSIYEMLYGNLHPSIAIAEAIRLCRKFSTPAGANFINAILDVVKDEVAKK